MLCSPGLSIGDYEVGRDSGEVSVCAVRLWLLDCVRDLLTCRSSGMGVGGVENAGGAGVDVNTERIVGFGGGLEFESDVDWTK
ncbi:hypothetical protein DKX38_022078 [Salix brachista]|uniref:Uncharacterized protein n=1 Tax=Salix brachista TaxID=2182728 RepID=A0A5N5JYT1_9ROSI|nr:hypothetical protein DKX38_022078 [Salix brachista]